METTLTDLSLTLFESSRDALLVVSALKGTILDANPVAASLFGVSRSGLEQRNCNEFIRFSSATFDTNGGPDQSAAWNPCQLLRSGQPHFDARVRRIQISGNGEPRELLVLQPLDATRDERFLLMQTKILEQLALGAPLEQHLNSIVLVIEELFPGVKGSILLLSDDGRQLHHGAAPSLPSEYNQVIDGIEIGDGVGSCGTAAFHKERVIVRDTQSDPLWEPYRELADCFDLGACWSQPIFSSAEDLLGTFAMYYSDAREPSTAELDFIDHAARLAGIAIERWRTESQLKMQHQELEAILDAVQAQVVYMDTQARAIRHNRASRELLGLDDDGIRGKTVIEQAPHLDNPELRHQQSLEVIRSGIPKLGSIEKFDEGEQERWVSVDKVPTFDNRGQVTGLLLFIYDITNLRLTEDALRESEERFRQLADNIDSAFWMFDETQGKMLYVSPAYEKIFGHSAEQMYGSPQEFLQSVVPEDIKLVHQKIDRQRLGEATEVEYRVVRPDGAIRWIRDRAFPIRNESGAVVRIAGIADDVTALKSTEEKLQAHRDELAHASRLTTMGEMAAGLAHELNQPLSAINNFSTVAEELITATGGVDAGRLRTVLSMLREQSSRAGQIVKRVSSFSARTTPRRSAMNINDVLQDAAQLLEVDLRRSRVQLSMSLDNALPEVSADAVQIQQVLVNLIRNAIDAIRENNSVGQDRQVTVETKTLEHHVEVKVLDTGPGLGDDADRVFEPFFTTREQGMGMGLRISLSIAEAHGGTLTAENQISGGAVFCLHLPVTAQDSIESLTDRR